MRLTALAGALGRGPASEDHAPEFGVVSKQEFYKILSRLNPAKASWPIPNSILKDHSEFLANSVTTILNASFKEQRLPNTWKLADASPLPKTKSVKEIKNDLRPISLTLCTYEVDEDFVVTQ